MSEQVKHALVMAAVAVGLGSAGALVEHQTNILEALNVSPVLWPIVGSVLAAAVRWLEGVRDAQRARDGIIQPSDVAYSYVEARAKNQFDSSAEFSQADPETILVDPPVLNT